MSSEFFREHHQPNQIADDEMRLVLQEWLDACLLGTSGIQIGEFTIPGLGEKGRGIFGFSVRSMAGGDDQGVKVRPFGNMHKAKEGVAIEEDRDPAVDVLQEGDRIRVIAELPGVSEADIEYEVKGDVLTISTKGARKYHAEVLLPQRAQKEGIQSSYNNGVLELKLAVSKGD